MVKHTFSPPLCQANPPNDKLDRVQEDSEAPPPPRHQVTNGIRLGPCLAHLPIMTQQPTETYQFNKLICPQPQSLLYTRTQGSTNMCGHQQLKLRSTASTFQVNVRPP